MGVWNGVELTDVTVVSRRLTLRRWHRDDAAAVFHGANGDPWMREFLPVPDPYTFDDAVEFVTGFADEGRADGTGFGAAIVETATGRVVGGAGLRLPIRFRPNAEIGYSIYPAARGHGYAAEVSDALARWAFGHGLGRVDIRCSVRNLASAKTALAAGFHFEGLRRADLAARGRIDDSAAFVRLAGDTGEPVPPGFPALPADGLRDDVAALRVAAPGDLEALLDEHDDPLSRRWAFDDKPTDRAQLESMTAAAAVQWLVGPIARMAIVDIASDTVAGSLQLRSLGPPDVGELGYGLRPAYRGRGHTTRALPLLMPWAFGPAGLVRLELGAKVANIASQKVALNAGFAPDGICTARLRNPDGSFSDEARFAAVRPDQTTLDQTGEAEHRRPEVCGR